MGTSITSEYDEGHPPTMGPCTNLVTHTFDMKDELIQ